MNHQLNQRHQNMRSRYTNHRLSQNHLDTKRKLINHQLSQNHLDMKSRIIKNLHIKNNLNMNKKPTNQHLIIKSKLKVHISHRLLIINNKIKVEIQAYTKHLLNLAIITTNNPILMEMMVVRNLVVEYLSLPLLEQVQL